MKKDIRLSVVISAFNEEQRIGACLESVQFADEVILVDNESNDKTESIAKKYGAIVLSRPNNPMLNINKNFGFSKASGKWILCLDADERVTPELAREIQAVISYTDKEVKGYLIPRKNIIFGKWIESEMWWPDYQLRLFQEGFGKFPEKHVHELVTVDGAVEKLTEPLIHESYNSVSSYLHKLDKIYTENEAEQIIASGRKLGWIDALRFPVNDFLKTFFLQKGYKNGLHGLVLSMLQAFYMEVVFAKVWERQGFQEENSKTFLQDFYKECRKILSEFRYWFLSVFMQETKSGSKKFLYRVLRKSLPK